jgi:NTE family protein
VTVGLVLAGGGARGAYEAGVLAELLPWLEERGERPTVLVGTSVGALTAAFLASVAHLPAREAVELLVARWGAVTQDRVIRPIVRVQSPWTLLRYAAELAGMPGMRLEGLLDASPLRRTVREWLDWQPVGANLEAGRVDALAVTATSARTERAVVFVQAREDTPVPEARLVDYVMGTLRAPDVTLMTRLLGGTSPAHAELLSYLFFQPQFIGRAIAAGRQDARAVIESGDPWRTGPMGGSTAPRPSAAAT